MDSDDISDNEEHETVERIKKEISEMSYEELQKLKEKIGSKMFNRTIHNTKSKPTKHTTEFKRTNKNRPREESSKIRPRRSQPSQTKMFKEEAKTSRDPRFDTLCGEFDKDAFKTNYKFLDGVKNGEYKQLKRQLKETENPEEQRKIKFLIQRYDNQRREQMKNRKKAEKKAIEHKEVREKLEKGEKARFKTKSERRLEDLVEQYEDLKKANRLDKHIEKRSKKIAQKQHVYFKDDDDD